MLPTLFTLLCSVPAAIAPQESVDALIQRGRALLAAGKPVEAQAAFDEAAVLDNQSTRTKVWVVRGRIANARFDEALEGCDELKAAKAPAADVDYLFGLAFLGVAKLAVSSQNSGNFTQSQFEDAFMHLQRALKADEARYSDAWLPLAEAAWYAQDLVVARNAADRAAALEPTNFECFAMLGRIVFSVYIAESDETAKETHWKDALAAFQKAVALLAEPTDPWLRNRLAEMHAQCGNLHGWKQDKPAASASYAAAMAWDPSRVDFGQVHTVLGAEAFLGCINDGVPRFLALHDERDPLYATLSWWNGFARFENAQWAESEAAFRTAVALWPSYANSWYYVFRATFSQQKYPESIEALRTYSRADPEGLTATLASDWGRNLQALNYLIGWCADAGKRTPPSVLNEDAAFLCGLLTKVEPQVARHWNNLGLFLRDQGDALRRRSRSEADPEVLADLWQRSYDAYARGLELAPEDPNFLNDTAVILHYYQKKDFDRVLAMYEKAAVCAEALLARKDLSPDDRAVYEIAKRDSNDNIRRLKKYLERIAAGEEVDPNSVR